MHLGFRTHVSATDTETDMVLLDERTGRYWYLNETAAFVLRHLLDGTEPADVVGRTTERFPVSEESAARDIDALVTSLCVADLVVVRP
ncbi:lasso peptide biosynthesis PqqD family chaperone [Streptomyces sp. NPDC056716]|uniref:lasso peptide biosynthesis PqqD family chaperone n=1 Tax=unclassified Streptomyces TaxID=2593676 RepID=UPI00368A721D